MMIENEIIERILGFSHEDHNETIYETGLKWLANHFEYMPQSYAMMESSPLFWKWWITQWNLRNSELVKQYNLEQIEGVDKGIYDAVALLFTEKHQFSMKVYPAKPLIIKIQNQFNLISKK